MGSIIERFYHDDRNNVYFDTGDLNNERKLYDKECFDGVKEAFEKLLDVLDIKYKYKNSQYQIEYPNITEKEEKKRGKEVFLYYMKSCCDGLMKMNKIISNHDPTFDMSKYLGVEDDIKDKLKDNIMMMYFQSTISKYGHINFCIVRKNGNDLDLYRYEPGGTIIKDHFLMKRRYDKLISKLDIDRIIPINQRKLGLQGTIPRGICMFFSLLVGTISMIILSGKESSHMADIAKMYRNLLHELYSH